MAIKYFQKALQIKIPIYGELHHDIAQSYNNIGLSYKEKGELDLGLEYHQKALQIRISVYGENHPEVAGSYINIGGFYLSKGEYDLALLYGQKALHIRISVLGEQHPNVAQCYNNIGIIYHKKGKYELALEYLQKALQIRISEYGELHPDIAISYSNIASSYKDKGEYNLALAYYDKALQIRISVFGELHPAIASIYNNIGVIYMNKGEYNLALAYYQKALMANVPGFNDTTVFVNPALKNILLEPALIETLTGKAKTFYQQYTAVSHSKEDLQASLINYKLAFELINSMRNEYNNEDTRLLLSETTKDNYGTAIRVALEYNNVNRYNGNPYKAFDLMEQGKSATMTARFNDYKAQHFAGIPDSLLEMEKALRKKIGFYTTQITSEKYQKDGYDTLKVNSIENEKFTCSRKLDSLITYFETTFPAYYELKYAEKTASITEIQKTLDHNTAVLDYFVSDSSLFIATITDSLYKMEELPIDSSFIKLVTKYYGDIKNADPEVFMNNSQRIYEKLIFPVKDYILGKAHLVIIPDDYLYYIPFETLIDKASSPKITNEDYSKLSYLIKSHSISYHHSATLWYNSKKKESELATRPRMNFIGLAPVFSKEQNNGFIVSSNINVIDTTGNNLAYRAISSDMKRFNPLPYSKDEVTSIVRLFEKNKKEAKAYIYGEANETNFKSNAGNYSIVHVSSHGFSNDNEPNLSGIVFSQPIDNLDKEDGILYTGETYNLNLHADLIVLSSCESGLGKLVRGEGLQALSRGFLYAGAPNVLFSLWKALDKPTKDLMVQFYSNTLEGKTYAEALQKAKLKLINDPKTAFPHFWSGFVLVGR